MPSRKKASTEYKPEEILRGTVTGHDGRLLRGAKIALFWQQLRTRKRLGQSKSVDDGRYEVRYSLPDDAPGRVLLVVQASGAGLKEPVESPPTPAAPGLIIDLAAPLDDPSAYGALIRALRPLLGSLSLQDIVENSHKDITLLSTETGLSKEEIMRAVVSARAELAFSIPAPAFYAFLNARMPSSLPPSLLDASQNFTQIDVLVQQVGDLIAALDPGQQTRTLTDAVNNKVVGPSVTDTIADIVEKFQTLHHNNMLGNPYLVGKTTLGQLLDTAGLAKDKQTTLAKALAENTQPLEKFWAMLADGQHGFTQQEVATMRQTLSMGAFVKNNLSLVTALRDGFGAGLYKTMPDLAKLSEQDWLNVIHTAGAGAIPANITGSDPTATFAREIYERVTSAYPTAALSVRTNSFVPQPELAPLTAFFTNNSELDLRRQNIDIYLNQKGEAAFAGVAQGDRPGVVQNLRAMQRVLRIVPHVDICEKLLTLGLNSASTITMMGKQQFVAKLSAAGVPTIDAAKTYDLARVRHAGSIALFMKFNRGMLGPLPQAIGQPSPDSDAITNAIAQNATLSVLFGSEDYCEVDDCTSILSPAAYLTDLLLWLSQRTLGVSNFPNALEVLKNRRPDLVNILLNCPNTDTELPYIDLVNELLADTISPPSPQQWRQTKLSAEVLRAAPDPDNLNTTADQQLLSAVFPHTLPYDAAVDQLQTVLSQSNVALWQVRQAFLPLHGPPPVAALAAVASARFGISAAERTLIITPNAASISQVWATANPATDLTQVSKFLNASGLTYEQLLELIEVAWASGGGPALQITGATDTCDTTSQTLSPLDNNRLDLIHRFLRLWRHTGWKMWELDLLLSSPTIGDPALSTQTLINLFTFRQLQDATGLSVDQIVSFYQDIDQYSHRDPDGTETIPLYSTLFSNPALAQDPQLQIPNLDGTTDLATHAVSIQAALQTRAADTATLLALTDKTRTLKNISLMYRVATLAQALELSVADLQVMGPQPLASIFNTPTTTYNFIQEAKAIAEAGFSVDQLTYVLTLTPTKSGITDAQVSNVITDVIATVQKVHQAVYGGGVTPFAELAKQFSQLPPSSDPNNPNLSDQAVAKTALSIVDGSFSSGDPARTNFINTQFALFMTTDELANAVSTLTSLSQPATGIALDNRANLVLTPLARYLTETKVIATVSLDLNLAADVTAYLIRKLTVPSAPPSTESLLGALTDVQLLQNPIPPQVLTSAQNAIRMLHKLGVVIGNLHLVRADLSWLVENASVYGGLELANLPIVTGQNSQQVSSLLNMVLLIKLNRSFTANVNSTASPPPSIVRLTDLISAVNSGAIPDDAHAQAAFASISGAAAADILAVSNAIGLSLVSGDWKNPSAYDRLRTLLVISSATSGSGAALSSWGIEAHDESAAAASALLALKSRYTPDTWLPAVQKINDQLRERRRDGYVAYLTGKRDAGFNPMAWGVDTNSLFDYFLIDSNMSACMNTSRIVQAYQAVQLFVERCLANQEQNVDFTQDDAWSWWNWMKRYRLWQANREIFLWPENWLIEADRPNRSEIFDKLMDGTHQTHATADALETVVLDYIGRLDDISHLHVTGMCYDQVTAKMHVVARTNADPPRFYHRTFDGSTWSPWEEIPLSIKAYQVVPTVHRRSLYLFWPEVSLANEPQQSLTGLQATADSSGNLSTPSQKSRPAARHVEIGIGFSFFRNGKWAPAQTSSGKFYDVPQLLNDPKMVGTVQTVERIYTLKIKPPTNSNNSDICVDLHRLGFIDWGTAVALAITLYDPNFSNDLVSAGFKLDKAPHIGRAVFDGRFNTMALRDISVVINDSTVSSTLNESFLSHAQLLYGTAAEKLVTLDDASSNPDLIGDSGLVPKAGGLATQPIPLGSPVAIPLDFTSTVSPQEQNVGTLLNAAQAPFVVVGPSTDLQFDPANDFVYTDDKRSYYVGATRWYEYGSQWRPVTPSNPADAPFEIRYYFRRFYHPYTKLFWHEIFNSGLPGLYTPAMQTEPWNVDPANGDAFSFQSTYNPAVGRVNWGEDNEIIDFSTIAPYSSYNWELFFHTPLYIAQALKLNQQFDDALTWLAFIFNPVAPGPAPAPQRFWVTAPFASLTTSQAANQQVAQLLLQVNQEDLSAITQVKAWENNPFNPFLVASMRPVAYLKAVVMAYVQTLLAHADALFATASRENLNQATLLLVRASEIMGPTPQAVPPPPRQDASFSTLQPNLDAFANAMVQIENVLPPSNASSEGSNSPLPAGQTFYFKIPPNDQLLSLWSMIDDRLIKLRNCLSLGGQPLALPLFDAPLDPGLLAAGEAGGMDLFSVISGLSAPLPNYRYVVMYAQAQNFCAAVRTFGQQMLSTLEKSDADNLALMLSTLLQQLLSQQTALYQAQIDEVNAQIAALQQAQAIQTARQQFYSSHAQAFDNSQEAAAIMNWQAEANQYGSVALLEGLASLIVLIPEFDVGATGAGGSPTAKFKYGGGNFAASLGHGASMARALAAMQDKQATIQHTLGGYTQRADLWNLQAQEAQTQSDEIGDLIDAANARLTVRTQQQTDWQTRISNLQQQIDFLTNKFTNQQLYDWMSNALYNVYLEAYNLAYAVAKEAEHCYRYELALPNASFIQYGHWNSLYEGLLAGEGLMTDLLTMQASYLDLNVRRYEISRTYSLAKLDPMALIQLLQTGTCPFTIDEAQFDADYPGHYQRQLKRVSVTVVYSNPGKNDNVSCRLTLVHNKVRMNTSLTTLPYPETPNNGDPRFAYQYGAVQTIVTSQAQDDPGLFENQVHYQINDPRYLPFEGAGAISDWQLELPSTNEIDVATVSDVQIHLLYTALDGGSVFKQAAINAIAPQSKGTKLFSSANDFAAPAPSTTYQYPLSPWQSFFATPPGNDQVLTLPISASKFPAWTRGKTINITGLTVYAVSWTGESFVLEPQTPLPNADVTLAPMSGQPVLLASGSVGNLPQGLKPGTWSFKLRLSTGGNFQSLTSGEIGDLILKIDFTAQ